MLAGRAHLWPIKGHVGETFSKLPHVCAFRAGAIKFPFFETTVTVIGGQFPKQTVGTPVVHFEFLS